MNRIKPVILAILTALFLKLFVFDFMIAKGFSMENTIHDGTILIISRLRYGIRVPRIFTGESSKYLIRWAAPKVGEVVVFRTPTGVLAVKRVTELFDGRGFYAQGDNPLASYDSRSYGVVPFENIIGKVLGY